MTTGQSEKAVTARVKVADWFADFDTRLIECPFGIWAIVNAIQSVTLFNGKSVAPFLESALYKMGGHAYKLQVGPYWLTALLLVGLSQLLALAIGTRRDTYLSRVYASFFSALIYCGIVLALLTGPQPYITAGSYALRVFFSAFMGYSLLMRHEDAIAQEDDGEDN